MWTLVENPADPNSDTLLGPRVTSGGLGAGSSLTQTSHARLAGALRRRSDARLGRGGWGSADHGSGGLSPQLARLGRDPCDGPWRPWLPAVTSRRSSAVEMALAVLHGYSE